MAELMHAQSVPRIIWTLWLQGWDKAPEVARASLASWRNCNPSWVVHALDRENLSGFITAEALQRITETGAPAEAHSDLVRFELLHRYGGVWADATTLCPLPVDAWLPIVATTGFFAFDRPGPDRLISTWFLAAAPGSYIVERWRSAAAEYWRGRIERDDYFWPHRLFGALHQNDAAFRRLWDETPKLTAQHMFHFGPNDPRLLAPPTPEHQVALRVPPSTVYKLTHKIDQSYDRGSMLSRLCAMGLDVADSVPCERRARRRLLVCWYGSFPGHGTIGDQRALEACVGHLVALGHEVMHATAAEVEIPGAIRVDWSQIDSNAIDAMLFVCGPIIKGHSQSKALFQHFAASRIAGVGVSLFRPDHPNHINPFSIVFAREGTPEIFGDLAILAPDPLRAGRRRPGRRIGLALRGEQGEYGIDQCLWRETEAAARAIAAEALEGDGGQIVEIENHIARSGLPVDEIERQYSDCDLIVTSRFHGAISALRAHVPFIAIDQIAGGAKVYGLLQGLGWPHVYKIESMNVDLATSAAKQMINEPDRHSLVLARLALTQKASRTLTGLDEWLERLSH